MSLCFRSARDQWFWLGHLGESTWRGNVCRLIGVDALAEIAPAEIFAVSAMGDSTSAGVCLFDVDGGSIALWTQDLDGFDAWLADVVLDREWQAQTALL